MSNLSLKLKELRKQANLTQKELADKIGISYGSIVGYENGLREPSSKALAALERYFHVSADYLLGNLESDTFYKNSKNIQGELDELINLFLTFKTSFSIASQTQQLLSVAALQCMIDSVSKNILHGNETDESAPAELGRLLNAYFSINRQGRDTLLERAEELTQLAKYKK